MRLDQVPTLDTLATGCQWFVAGLLMLLLLHRYRNFAGDFYRFTLTYRGLAFLIVVLYALVFAQVGRAIGIPYLFWHEDFITRASASWGATLLMGLVGVIAYYLDPYPWATDQKTAAWLVQDEAIKRRVAAFWWRLAGKAPPPEPHPLPQGDPLTLADVGIFALNTLVDPLSATPVGWLLDPRRENQVRLHRFLRTCRTPFLLLLLAPAVLPGVFSNVPRVAPTGGLWTGPPPLWEVTGFYRGGSSLAGYVLSVASWMAGMIAGVLAVKVTVRISEFFSRAPEEFESTEALEGHPEWARPDRNCPRFEAADCPGTGCPRGARRWGVGPPDLCVARHTLRTSMLVFLLFFILTYLAFRAVPPLNQLVSPAFSICALLALAAMAYAIVGQFRPMLRPVVVGGVILWVGIANNQPFKIQFPRMDDEYRHPLNLRQAVDEAYFRRADMSPLPPSPLIPDAIARAGWLRQVDRTRDRDLDAEGRPKLVIVAVSGGAARSTFWTAVVLDRLERVIPEFGRRVRIITGASGGMLGTAYYVRHRVDLAPHGASVRGELGNDLAEDPQFDPLPWHALPADWVENVPLNSLEPVAKTIALHEVWQALSPLPQTEDRGLALERDWRAIAFPFQRLARLESEGEIPSLIVSPMLIEDGRQLLISNLDLYRDERGQPLERPVVKTVGRDVSFNGTANDLQSVSLPGLEFYRLFPRATGLLLSTAVRMNASFSYISPAVNLPTQPPRRVVDAGYYDNYGIRVAMAWIDMNQAWLEEHTSGVLLVQIRDSSGVRDRLDIRDEPPSRWAAALRGFQFFSSPIDGFLEARYTSAAFRNDTEVAARNARFGESLKQDLVDPQSFFTTVIFENSADVTVADEQVWTELERLYEEAFVSRSTRAPAPEHHRVREVTMTWYLTRTERQATRRAFPPDPPPSSPLANADARTQLEAHLQQQVFHTLPAGPERDIRLKRLEQLRNYMRLVNLQTWWRQSGARRKTSVRGHVL